MSLKDRVISVAARIRKIDHDGATPAFDLSEVLDLARGIMAYEFAQRQWQAEKERLKVELNTQTERIQRVKDLLIRFSDPWSAVSVGEVKRALAFPLPVSEPKYLRGSTWVSNERGVQYNARGRRSTDNPSFHHTRDLVWGRRKSQRRLTDEQR